MLSQRGLDAALESLASRAPVPVELESALDERLPSPVETAAYFVVAEALTNVAKYARRHARPGRGPARERPRVIDVRDDGIGGADAASGSGCVGSATASARSTARSQVDSPPGGGHARPRANPAMNG